MQVTCPGCQSRFRLPEGVQPGTRLRCSVCGAVFALPGESEAQAPLDAAAPEGSSAGQAEAPASPNRVPAPVKSPDAADAPGADDAPRAADAPGAGEAANAPGTPDAPETAEAPAFPDDPEASEAAEASDAAESPRRGWAVWLLVLALAAGACLCIAWQISEGFREAVMGKPQAELKQPAAPQPAGPSTAGPAPAAPAQAGGGVAQPAEPDASAEGDGAAGDRGPANQAGAPASIEKLTLQNVRQYFVENKKEGRILVVEGCVRNLFSEPRSAIRVEAVLIGRDKKTVEAKRQTAGAQLSHFQLQVMDKVEMEAALASEADISLTNANVPPGGEVPFMVLFYNPSPDVAEFAAKILEARHPAR